MVSTPIEDSQRTFWGVAVCYTRKLHETSREVSPCTVDMDPASIIGLTAAIQQILVAVYNVADGVRESKDEINQLCSELLALKAALDHVQMNLSLSSGDRIGGSDIASSLLTSPNLSTFEFKEMIASAETIVKELLTRLDKKSNALKASLQRLKWPFIKDDVKRYVERLHRLTSWFVLATTSDNM
jgi:hypothetical protein